MERHWYYIGIAFFGMINGMFSPLRIFSLIFTNAFLSEVVFGSQSLIFYLSSLMLSTATVIIGGLPAALYERVKGITDDSTEVSLWIWLAGTAILALPAVGTFLQIGL
jgi:hypothetical protein